MYYFMVFLTLVVIAFILWYFFSCNVVIHTNWLCPFDKTQFSPQEFYDAVEKSLKEREVPGISFSRVSHVTTHRTIFLDDRREYLCANRKECRFQMCAAPFGTGFFVSYWVFELERGYITFLKKIPILKTILNFKTFYQIDMDTTFRSFVHMCTLEAIDAMTTEKGMRALTEYERRLPKDRR